MNLELNLFDGEGALAAPEGLSDAADAQPQNTPDTTAPAETDKAAEFENLIKGEFKEQFEQRIKDNLKRRFKESSSLKARISQSDEIIGMLKTKYGIVDDNMALIADAIKNDDGFLKAEAQKRGLETDTFKKLKDLEYENESMKRQIARGLEERRLNETISSWITDAKELKKTYPDFDLGTEAQNPGFVKLLRAGLDLKNAYYATHHEDIVKSMVEKASRETSLKITDSIRARGARPSENGISGQSTAIIKTDVSKLTPQERARIAQRVMQGEEISF